MTFMNRRHAVVLFALTLCVAAAQAFAPAPPDDEKPKNLKVLPKNISHDELIQVMRGFSKSLGVHCDFCHKKIGEGSDGRPQLDFASDEKDEKKIARQMMKMTAAINKKYIGKMAGGHLDQIACVTCHMGHEHPLVNVDSLKAAK